MHVVNFLEDKGLRTIYVHLEHCKLEPQQADGTGLSGCQPNKWKDQKGPAYYAFQLPIMLCCSAQIFNL